LHDAAYNGHPKIAQILIDEGVDVNVQDKEGNTPLHLCFGLGRGEDDTFEDLQILINAGANVDVRNKTGETPLHWAMSSCQKNIEAIKYLIQSGAKADIRDNDGNTPLECRIVFEKELDIHSPELVSLLT